MEWIKNNVHPHQWNPEKPYGFRFVHKFFSSNSSHHNFFFKHITSLVDAVMAAYAWTLSRTWCSTDAPFTVYLDGQMSSNRTTGPAAYKAMGVIQ